MPLTLRTRLVELSPERIALTANGQARVRVRGHAYGYVVCGGERRWVWGAFDQTFVVRPRARALQVRALGIGGWTGRRIQVARALDLSTARPRPLRRTLRWSLPRIPRLPPLSAATLQRGLGTHE